MANHEIECRLVLKHSDFIMQNHRVHGVSVMPGVTFLDIVSRILIAQGLDVQRALFRNILFSEAIATTDGFDREIRIRIGEARDGVRQVIAESRWLEQEQPRSIWRENFRSELVFADEPEPAALNPAALKSAALRTRDMGDLYASARIEQIRHGRPMQCFGPIYVGDGYMLAELRLDPAASVDDAQFYLHPAKLDASTIAAYSQTEAASHDPFIPVFIERFRAPRPLHGPFYVYAPRVEVLAPTGDVIHNDYFLYDQDGSFVAEFGRLTCKRIRHPQLITRLVEEISDPGAASSNARSIPTEAPAATSEPAGSTAQAKFAHYLRVMVAGLLGKQPNEIKTNVGFYDLGLDSVALLRVSQELEQLVGSSLYPTLLFEFSDIDSLAAHLGSKYQPPQNGRSHEKPGSLARSAVPETALETACYRPVWMPLQASSPSTQPGDLVVFTASDDLAPALRQTLASHQRRVIQVKPGASFQALGPDAYRLDFRSREQIGALLATLTRNGALPRSFVHYAAATSETPSWDDVTGACLSVWALAAALIDQKPDQPCDLVYVYARQNETMQPHNAAVGALARTIAEETPLLRLRAIEIESGLSAGGLADVVLTELASASGDYEIRYRGVQRQVKRFTSYTLGSQDAPIPLKDRGVYLLTGGAGGLGRIVADHLARNFHARLVLVGRSAITPALQECIEQWQRQGAEAFYIQADIARETEVAGVLAKTRQRFGRLDGVLHCAGVVRDALFFRKSREDLEAVLAPKVLGAIHLDRLCKDENLDFFVLFSSLSAAVANAGQCDYAFANAFLEHFAEWRAQRSDRPGKTLAIGWPLWAEGGMQVAPEIVERARQSRGLWPLPTADGLNLLRGLAGPESRFYVLYGERDRLGDVLPQAFLPITVQPESALSAEASAGSRQDPDIAIIGLAGQYPQAPDLDIFWQNLETGRDCITEVPADRWEHTHFFDAEKGREGKTYSKWGGFIDGVDRFDPAFFGISRKDAERMDPQERLFLKTCWKALEDAGYTPGALASETVGVFVGVMWNHYQLFQESDSEVMPTAMHAAIANRVSYTLNLRGPSMAVDTACSSSLTAIHLAVESIRRGEATLALAGGVNVTIHPQKYLQLAQGQFLATDGRCRSFGKDGSGYVPGEGVGAVLLKPLARAQTDGDHIYGVIKGSYLNHTGRTSGFTVPSPTSQAALIREAFKRAGIMPETVGYIEAHGTGTSLGDPIEIEGLRQAFADANLPPQSCAIGSVKSNIGHLESAAGIAGLTKVLLQMKHGKLVPSLHAHELNPHIDFATSPFYVQRELTAWPASRHGTTMRAGISAFGAGGANAHLVLESYESVPSSGGSGSPCLFVLSASDPKTLEAYARSFVAFIERHAAQAESVGTGDLRALLTRQVAEILAVPVEAVEPRESLGDLGFDPVSLAELVRRLEERYPGAGALRELTLESTIESAAESWSGAASMSGSLSLDDLAYTLQVGRVQLPTRMAVVARTVEDLRSELERFLRGEQPAQSGFWGEQTPTVGSLPTGDECAALFRQGKLHEVAACWVAGVDVPWQSCYPRSGASRLPQRMPLPTYPFREESCWIGRWKSGGRAGATLVTPADLRRAAPTQPASPAQVAELSQPAAPVPPYSGNEVEFRILDHQIALVIMRDHEHNNMFTEGLIHGLEAAFAEIARNPEIKAVVVSNSGNVFSMGGTPDALKRLASKQGRFTDVPFLYEGLLRCDRPVIAAIQGHASGGGLIFGLHADIVVMSRDHVYSANFMKYGFTPGMGATYILEQRFGRSVATEMFFTGKAFGGDELERRGGQVMFLPRADVFPAALDLARSISDKPLSAIKALKTELAGRALEQLPEIIAREVSMHERVLGSESIERIQEHLTKLSSFNHETVPASAAINNAPIAQTEAVVVEPVAVTASRPDAVAPIRAEQLADRSLPGRDAVEQAIKAALCEQLYLERQEINPRLTFNEMGVDSIGAVEIVRRLNQAFGLDLDSVTVYDYPTIARLAEHVLQRCSEAQALHQAASQTVRAVNGAESVLPVAAKPEHKPEPPAPKQSAVAPQPLQLAASKPLPLASKQTGPVALKPLGDGSARRESQSQSAAINANNSAASSRIVLKPTAAAPVAEPEADRSPKPALRSASTDIAIIGMSGRFPDAPDLETFWSNLAAGRCSIAEVPADRWEIERFFDPDRHVPNKTYSKWGAFLSDVSLFDAGFFHISPLEAEAMDPQQRLFLEEAWAVLEDAGYAVTAGEKRRCGVFVGCGAGDYARLLQDAGQNETGQAFLGNSTSILAARIGYFLNLKGPTIAVDTACSSSLVAVHLACESIRSGECEMALAGGVAVMVTPQMHIWTSKTGMLSPSGQCAPFDASADGIVLGEGVGVVVLKPLAKALADGDHIYGVIKGSGVNGDGKTNGITAPSAASQADLLLDIYERAGISPNEIGYVEAHGTGTALGDPIEFKALNQVFRQHSARRHYCGIGSVKSNIGHTTMSAGIAGLLKVLLALKHRQLPPSLHFQTINPKIDLADSPFFVVSQLTDWQPNPAGSRIGVVSSFGFSGTNCHVVIAEAPAAPARSQATHDPYVLVPVSARTENALQRRLEQLDGSLSVQPDLHDLAFTLSVGRAHFPVRVALVVHDLDDLERQVRSLLEAGALSQVLQRAGEPETAAQAHTADLLARLQGVRDPELLRAGLEALANAYMQGHDPDWAALWRGRAGRRIPLPTYPFERQRYWVEAAPPVESGDHSIQRDHPLLGSLVATASTDKQLVFERTLHPADWIVADHKVAGKTILPGAASLELAVAAAQRCNIAAPLQISAVQWLRPFEVTEPRMARFSAFTEDSQLAFELAGAGEQSAVCSRGTISTMVQLEPLDALDLERIAARCSQRRDAAEIYAAFARAGIDYGPSFQVLEYVAFNQDEALGWLMPPPAATGVPSSFTLHPSLVDGALQAVAVLESQSPAGPLVPFSLDMVEIFAPLVAPVFSYVTRQGQHRFNVLLTDAEGRICARCQGFTLRPQKTSLENMILVPEWRETPAASVSVAQEASGRKVAVVYAPAAQPLAQAVLVLHADDETSALMLSDDPAAFSELKPPFDLLYFLVGHANSAGDPDRDPGALNLFRLIQTLIRTDQARRPLSLKIVTDGIVPIAEDDVVRPHAAGLLGLSRAIAAEYKRWTVGCIDVGAAPYDPQAVARQIVGEPLDQSVIALRGERRLSRVFVQPRLASAQNAQPFKREGVYLIVGGAGGIGFALSRHLAREVQARLVWIGRRPLDADLKAKIAEIESLGGKVLYVQADVADPVAMQQGLTAARQQFGSINGAFHAALVMRDKTLANMDEAMFNAVLAPKVRGATVLFQVLQSEPLDFLVFFSSAASFVDPGGQANYAAASTFEDALAWHFRRQASFPVAVINWGYWGSVGAVANDYYRRRFAVLGVGSIEPAEGIAALSKVIAANLGQSLVIKADPARLAEFGIQTAREEDPVPARETPFTVHTNMSALNRQARAYIKRVFAEVLKAREADLGERETFENFGVDSLVGINIIHRLEQDLGELPATLLFEYMTIEHLAGYLLQERGERLAALLQPAVEQPAIVVEPAPAAVERSAEQPTILPAPSSTTTNGTSMDIAVIGVSGRYPDAPDIATFWRNLASGKNCVTEIPAERWDWRTHYDPKRGQQNRSYGKWAGFIEGVDLFDPAFFNILPRDAETIDPQERLFLETCWNLLEETGYLGEHTRVTETGVFVGVMYGSYGKLAAATGWPRGQLAGAHSAYWSIANRVSYFFDFQGPSFAVDSACSSSLTAVHLACESLRRGECRMAIAGGVNVILHPAHFVALSAMNMLSSGGGCRVFDDGADGYVPGEGVGAVLLKPLDQAIADGDEIWGVIKASFVNAGGKTSGYTVPNPNAQAHLIEEALRRAGVHPRTITYVEAHGTGTELGDPIEIASLTRAFSTPDSQRSYCAVGSVKANIGHLEGAAGIAGLTKALLQLKHGKIAPCVNLEQINPKIDFASSPVYPQQSLAEWQRPILNLDGQERVYPRRAGVSSFGAGGANAHVILEEYQAPEPLPSLEPSEAECLFVLSAKTRKQLSAFANRVAAFLTGPDAESLSLRDLAYTSQIGRREMVERVAVLARSKELLAERLRAFANGESDPLVFSGTAGKNTSSQLLLSDGDGAAFIESLLRKRQLAKLAQIWVMGISIDWRLLWPAPTPRRVAFPTYPFERKRYWLPTDEPVAQPREAQWDRHQVEATLQGDAFYLTDHRIGGSRWVPGVAFLEMARAACPDPGLETPFQIRDLRWPAPLNLDDGSSRIEIVLERKAEAINFRISGLDMQPQVFARGVLSPGASAEAGSIDLAAAQSRCLDQIDPRAFYTELAEGGLDYGPAFQVVHELHVGDQECLARLVLPAFLNHDFDSFMLHPALMDGALQALAALNWTSTAYLPVGFAQATIYQRLAPQCWVYLREVTPPGSAGSRRFDLRIADQDGRVLVVVEGLEIMPYQPQTTVCRYSRPVWKQVAFSGERRPARNLLLLTDDEAVRAALLSRFAAAQCVCVVPGSTFAQRDAATYEIVPGEQAHYQRLADELARQGRLPDSVLHFWSRQPVSADSRQIASAVDHGLYSVFWLATALLAQKTETPLRMVFAHAAENSGLQPHYAAVGGALRTLALEHSRFSGVRVALEGTDAAASAESIAALLADEIEGCAEGVTEIRYRDSERWQKVLESFDPAPVDDRFWPPLRPGATYLITGGAGVLGLRFAAFLAQHGPLTIVLAGRSELDAQTQARIDALSRDGVTVRYHRADLQRPDDVQRLIREIRASYGPLYGVIHAAGVTRDSRALKKTGAEIDAVLGPKVYGTVYLDEATQNEPLDFFVLFSSVVAEMGNLGQADYAYANAFLNEFAAAREQQRQAGRRFGKTLSICWPLWKESGMTVDAATLRLFVRKWGMVPMSTKAGLRAFCQGLIGEESCFLVVEGPSQVEVSQQPAPTESKQLAVSAVEPAPAASSAPAGDYLPLLERDLRVMTSRFLLVDEQEVDLEADLMDLGFDSISLTELINQINEKYGLDLLPTVLFECTNLVALSRYLQANHQPALEACYGTPAQTVDSSPVASVAIEEQQLVQEREPVAIEEPQPEAGPLDFDPGAEAQAQPLDLEHVGSEPGAEAQAQPEPAPKTDVAIIGMAGLMPQSEDLETFWRHLITGDDLVVEVPENRADLRNDPNTCEIRGGFLHRVDSFDAQLFGISPREAALMDPQQRIFLETVWRAIEDAGYKPSDLAGSLTGLFAGVSTSDYDDLLKEHGVAVEAHTATGIAHSILANRISYLLDLRGPSEAVDTACSSSLVAIHRAVRAISDGECDLAIAGGVNVILSPGLFTAFTKSGMLSPDGRCKTFDAAADGYVRGEGSGAIVLKPLDRAIADGDHIYAIVKGSAVNHGGRSNSLTAPNPEAQARVLVKAYSEANIDPDTVTYIEAHGTGTRLGDPVEIEGLRKAFARLYEDWQKPLPARPHIAIGAVKTNIGHLESAAGIAGVLKVLLCMQHGELPGNLHFKEVNPYIRLEGTPFYINQQTQRWAGVPDEADQPLRRAGVSSFGFGGTNAHLVLEAYRAPAESARRPEIGEHLLVLSAPTSESLAGYARRMARFVETHPETDLTDLAYTLQVGREELAERLAIVASDRDRLVQMLNAAAEGQSNIAGLYRGSARSARRALADDEQLEQLAQRWVEGAKVEWARLYPDRKPRRVAAPSFPFSKTGYWFNTHARKQPMEVTLNEWTEHTRQDEQARERSRGPKVKLAKPASDRAARPSVAHETATTAVQAATNRSARLNGHEAAAPEPVAPEATSAASQVSISSIAEIVKGRLGEILGIAPQDIREDQQFNDLGLDSIYRMDLVRLLNATFSLDLKAVELYDYDTVERLAQFVASALAGQSAAAAVEAIQQPAARQESAQTTLFSQTRLVEPRQQPAPLQVRSVGGAEERAIAAAQVNPVGQVQDLLNRLICETLDRSLDSSRTFADNGFTSFDMLKVIAALEKRFGALRKTLLFDRPTLAELAAYLYDLHGQSALERLDAAIVKTQTSELGPVPVAQSDHEPVILRKVDLHKQPHFEAIVADLEQRYGKEGGLPGRDIAPLIFLGSDRKGYFNVSRRENIIFSWSYVGSVEYFLELTREYVEYARRNGLKPNLLSMIRIEQAGDIPFTATPFGAIQRLEDLSQFTLKGNQMQRLRYMINRFERMGACRTVEYRVGSSPAIDHQIADLIDQWCQNKDMVNPYVYTVRGEIRNGILQPRHRMFLTYLDERLVCAVIITRIPSENGYLLDLEFYPGDMPLGGLDFTIVRIIEQLIQEGYTIFSFGASIGAKICDSPNADPVVSQALEELRSLGIFTGEGNFRFKNKFRPTNLPIYLCQPADSSPTDVSDIILLIANPTVAAAKPESRQIAASNGSASVAAAKPEPLQIAASNGSASVAAKTPRSPRPASSGGSAQESVKQSQSSDAIAMRDQLLSAHGYNPVNVPHRFIDFDLLTDSWAELEGSFIDERMIALISRLIARRRIAELSEQTALPFSYIVPTSSGRSAEAALCRAWPRRNQIVVQNVLFPTWNLNQLDNGFTPVVVKDAYDVDVHSDAFFKGDLSIPNLKELLAKEAQRVAFIAIETSNNATGGYPISLGNLKQVKEVAASYNIPLVLDGTRIIENALFIEAHEDGYRGRDIWEIVREMLLLADSATFSLTKDFGINTGGIVATNDPTIAEHLREHVALRGWEVNLTNRKLIALVLDDKEYVVAQVQQRLQCVQTIWQRLADSGVPVVRPAAGHCVLLDVAQMPLFSGFRYPVQACLAWIYRNTGIRATPHLAGSDKNATLRQCIRLAIPVGLTLADAETIAERLVALFREPGSVSDLMPVDSSTNQAQAAYYPVDRVPDDIRESIEEGYQARNENWAVLREYQPAIKRQIVRVPEGDAEVFTAGAGPTLLLVHPFNIGAGFFAPQFQALADRYRVVVIHAPGVGATRAAADLSFDGLARLYMQVLRKLGYTDPVHIAGASFGGVTAQAFALQYPHETASLILIGSSYKLGNRAGEMNRLAVVAKEDFDHVIQRTGSQRLRRERSGFEELLLRCESMDPQTGLRYLDEFAANHNMLARLPEISVPTLIVQGRHDSVISLKTAHLLHGTIPDVRYEEIAEAGHFPSLTSADEFHQVLIAFLDDLDAQEFDHRANGKVEPADLAAR